MNPSQPDVAPSDTEERRAQPSPAVKQAAPLYAKTAAGGAGLSCLPAASLPDRVIAVTIQSTSLIFHITSEHLLVKTSWWSGGNEEERRHGGVGETRRKDGAGAGEGRMVVG